jgi:hypothetical protein
MRFESAPRVIRGTRQFFTNGNSSARRHLLLALILLSVLTACLPVPVGDPEKSRIDPALSGAWRVAGGDDEQMLMVLDPYDKRTWLVTLIGLGDAGDNRAGQVSALQVPFNAVNADSFRVTSLGVYKCWLTRIGGETFMTWESKTLSETLPNMVPEQWWAFRVRKSGDDTFYLDSFDYSIDGLDKVTTSKDAEKIIRRHIDDPGFFEEKDAPRLDRLPADDVATLPRLLENFGFKDTM